MHLTRPLNGSLQRDSKWASSPSLTPPRSAAPQVYSNAPSVDADTDRCPAYETNSEANEPDYAALFAAEINAADKTDEAAPQKGRKRKANHVVDRRPLTRSRA